MNDLALKYIPKDVYNIILMVFSSIYNDWVIWGHAIKKLFRIIEYLARVDLSNFVF